MTLPNLAITALYAGLTALLLIYTSIRVTVSRVKLKVNLGDGGKPEMLSVMRTQANLVEYASMTLILLALLELGGTATWLLHTLGIAFIVARLIHVTVDLGAKPGAARGIGATLTWVVIVVGGILAIAMSRGILVK